jgi:hypothetical protein
LVSELSPATPEVTPVIVPDVTSAVSVTSELPIKARTKSTLNLQNIFNVKETAVETNAKPESLKTSRTLNITEVKEALNEFATTRMNQVAEYSLLQRDFELKNNVIVLQLTNPVEEPLLQSIKSDLVDFLKSRLSSDVLVEGVVLKTSSKKVIYTNKEKFDHMAEKNPLLFELRERLGLDTDY